MSAEQAVRSGRIARILVSTILALALLFVGLLVWTGRSTVAMDEALNALSSDEQVAVTTNPWLVFTPLTATVETGFIFYPGGRVDPRAYAPAAHAIAAEGYLVVIVPMPLNLAAFAPNRALEVIAAYRSIEQWAIGGHSLGGAIAASFVAQYPRAVDALVLWASYPGKEDGLARRRDLAVTSIYGTLDGLSTVEKITTSRTLLPPQSNFIAIEGGNHAQFGWYGEQRGDNPATIPHDTQQAQVVAATVAALADME